MGILSWLLVGILIGSAVSRKTKAHGFVLLGYLVVSILGALLGGLNVGYLYQVPGAISGINWMGIFAALLGALLANALLHLLLLRKNPTV